MNTLTQILYTVSYMILPLFLAMVFHEYAHRPPHHNYTRRSARFQRAEAPFLAT